MQHVFIIGSKGIPARYGGFETFVEKLTEGKKSKNIQYHVACMSEEKEDFWHNGAHCFPIKVPDIGPAKAVYYDVAAFRYCNRYIREHGIRGAIVYVLACRIGPFIKYCKKSLCKMGGKVYVNPDGHEWKRAKWNCIIKKYWKLSEKWMVKYSDLLICDSRNIEKYIQKAYPKYNPRTTYISYGAVREKSALREDSARWQAWTAGHGVTPGEYFLVVGRFVPENNYETIIKEFMKSSVSRDLVLVTNVEKNRFYENLRKNTGFEQDRRIKFVGTIYDQELLRKVREEAFAYIHGHEVGGTNPSLLEALACTEVNLLLEVGFNREVADKGALYWGKKPGDLRRLIENCENMGEAERKILDELSAGRIEEQFGWDKIIREYEGVFGLAGTGDGSCVQ